MEQELKQRIVGAVVITSLAAIFIPMLFDDPIDETGKMIGELQIPQAPANSLNPESANLPRSAFDVISLPKPEALKVIEENQPKIKLERWFVQAASFGQKDNAVTLQDKIRKQGFPATIKRTENGMYKVLAGPVLKKERAEKMQEKIDKANNVKSIISSVDD